MQTEETTLAEFIERAGITTEVTEVESNPNMDGMPAGSRHFLVTFKRADESMEVFYSQGPGIEREPATEDVLDCIASDVASVENSQGFDDWATELGFFPMESSDDMNKALKTWQAIEEQAASLKQLLGSEATEELLWNTERL